MEETVNQKVRRETLVAYSEWLDADENLLHDDNDDGRTHEDLVNQFLDEHGEYLPNFPGTFLETEADDG